MPFTSKAQRRYLFANNPAVAQRFAAETPKGATLPNHVPAKAKAKKRGPVAMAIDRMTGGP